MPTTRLGAIAVLAMASLSSTILAQPPAARTGVGNLLPLRYRQDIAPLTCTAYADGKVTRQPASIEWKPICGSAPGALTPESLKAIADNHTARAADGRRWITINNTPPGQRGAHVDVIFNIDPTDAPVGYATAFAQAETYIESKWADPITITVSVTWADLGPSVLGSTGSFIINNYAYTDSRAGLVGGMDGTDTIQSFLPTGSTIPVRFNATAATVTNVSQIDWTTANFRSTVGSVVSTDSNMQYSTTFPWDFDPTNGVTAGAYSLVDVVIHEVGHSMGFVSKADNQAAVNDIYAIDMFRFAQVDRAGIGNTNPDTTADFGTVAREVDYDNPTNDDVISDLISAEYRMSDGNPRQASHLFQLSGNPALALGIMQPALASGGTFGPEYYRPADLNLFDAIGWDELGTCSAPVITANPAALTRCPGVSATFTVTATGTSPAYQWRKNSVNIAGATSASYTIASPAAGDAGSYDCVVSNGCGSTTSTAATLTMNSPPAFTTNPAAATRCPGVSVTFTVANSGTPAPTRQWRKNGVNIAGATGLTYTIASPVAGDAGTYDCVATNTCGSVTSSGAVLTMNSAPAITTQPVSITRCPGVSASFTVAASGLPAPTFQWRKNSVNIPGATSATFTIASPVGADAGSFDCVVTNTCGSVTSAAATLTMSTGVSITTQPAGLTRCPGVSATFTVAASGSPAPTFQWRKNSVSIGGATSASFTIASPVAGDAGSYDCVVTNSCGSQTSSAALLTMNSAPTIGTQPSPQSACTGGSATFTMAAGGNPAPTFQWRKNGVNIAGATSSSFTLNPVVAGDAANYDCVATNTCGSATTTAVALTINAGPSITTQPAGLTRCPGVSATFTVAASGSPAPTFQWRKNSVNIGGATSASFTIASPVAGDAGSYDCVVTNSCGSTTSSGAVLTMNAPVSITTQPAGLTRCTGTSASFTVTASGTPAPTFQWRKNSVNIPGATAATLTLNPVVAGDAAGYDCVVTNACGSTNSSLTTLTVNAGPGITTQPSAQSACVGGSASFTVAASGTPAPTLQWRKNGVDIAGATGATLTLNPVAAGDAATYDCVATNSCASITSSGAALTVNTAPAVTTQPTSQTPCAGASVTFTIAAGGSPAPTFQWRKNGVNIGGATLASYSISDATASDDGSYDCVVTNLCGSVTSSAATLAVRSAPTVTTSPSPQTVPALATASFSVAASGSGPLTYQWRRNTVALTDGADISGSATPSLTINPAKLANVGTYDCIVTNTCGAATSGSAFLDVLCRPDWDHNFQIQPVDVGLFITDWSASLSAGTLVGDYDGSGTITTADVAVFVSDWAAAAAGGC